MGRKIKTDIDWSLDKGNKVGDVVVLAQHAQTKLGVVSFLGQAPVYDYYANLVKEAYAKSQKLHERVLELPILSGPNLRYLQDPALLREVYQDGSQLVVNIYLMFEYIALYAGITAFRRAQPDKFDEFERLELKDKLKELLELYGNIDLLKSDGYGALFSDIEIVRHAINHPKGINIYSADESKWDDVPIAWFVSGKHLDACSKAIGLYNQIHDNYVKYSEAHKIPGEITIDGPIKVTTKSNFKKRR